MFAVKTILHPTDFSDCSRQAFRLAATLAREQNAHLVVLHVNQALDGMVPYCGVLSQLQPAEYKDWLWKVLHRFQVADAGEPSRVSGRVHIEHRLVQGNPAKEILRVADEINC